MKNGVEVIGLEDVREQLLGVGVREGRNLMRATIRGVTSRVRKGAANRVSVLTGKTKRSLKIRQKKSHPDKPTFEVLVGSGKGVKYDAFYWRFVEYGTRISPAKPFIRPAVEEVRAQLPSILRSEFGQKWEKAVARKRKKAAQAAGE